jgi:hypothetical protein
MVISIVQFSSISSHLVSSSLPPLHHRRDLPVVQGKRKKSGGGHPGLLAASLMQLTVCAGHMHIRALHAGGFLPTRS